MLTRVEAILSGASLRDMRHIVLLDDTGDKYEHEFFAPLASEPEPVIRIGACLWAAGQVNGPSMLTIWYDKVTLLATYRD